MKTVFNTASFAFRQVDYRATGDWGQACRTSREHFSPVETLAERFDAMLAEIDDLGYKQLELWHFHLHQKWWTPEHVDIVLGLLKQRQMTLVSYCGGFGDDLPEVERTLNLVNALGIPLLAGATGVFRTQRAELVARLKAHGVRLGRENHPEKTPQEILDLTGPDEGGCIGITVDTGWLGTQNYPADQALRELGERVYHVHLKDVFHAGPPHETCGFGQGVVPLESCVQALKDMNYPGFISVEHEPEQFDPRPDLKEARIKLEGWLGGWA
ncbi:sugar phosphate isomerase/epimerase [Deinococcus irradiatisoli]|uniref:Sugar phosphate isomerase/epimerase n=1 Tax=Deinococcus irradiatisoli TaxID=2202254 RepID=A0A2Z3JFM6_9DEIO|nr:sugar phosphate isomerase/epimerase [Deinococcus irradiatisoli]AWN22160.1 sugar phosphate isomerase/epimerase [Deinococcus irradiatisoli]